MMVQRIFHLKSERQRTLRMLFGDCRLIYFYSLTKSAFLLSKGLLRLYDKHNNTWTVKNIWRFHIFIFIHSYIHTFIHSYIHIHTFMTIIHGCLWIWYFSSCVQLDISLVCCAHSWTIELNTRREIPYLRAPMYYSLYVIWVIK